MKKILLPLLVLSFLAAGLTPVYAVGLGGACTTLNDCDGNYICTAGKCAVDPQVDASAPTTATPPASSSTGTANTNTGFVSLTNIPALEGAGNSATLPIFLNNVYKICIGLAAVLAVLQLMRAGVMYMGGDSFTEKKQARDLIAMSLVGLLLVLAPTIVFSIINPDILSLKIGNLDQLNIGTASTPTTAGTSSGFNVTHAVNAGDTRAACTSGGGTATLICYNSTTKKQDPVSTGGTCPTSGDTLATDCQTPVSSATSICSSYEVDEYGPIPSGETCQTAYAAEGNTGVVPIDTKCCDASATPEPGYVCCAHPISH
jgi:hypothetical protein